jgi:hypothetical protein
VGSAAKKRHGTLKPLCETRWESRVESVKPFRYQLGEIYDSLIYISEDETLRGVSGTKARAEAKGLAGKLKNFSFMVLIVFW